MLAMPIRACSSAPRPAYEIRRRTLPLCSDLANPPDALVIPPQLLVLPPVSAGLRFGCFLPKTETEVTSAGYTGDVTFEQVTETKKNDPCRYQIRTKLTLPEFVMNPALFPPCGSVSAESSLTPGAAAVSLSVQSIDPTDPCVRVFSLDVTLPPYILNSPSDATTPPCSSFGLASETVLGFTPVNGALPYLAVVETIDPVNTCNKSFSVKLGLPDIFEFTGANRRIMIKTGANGYGLGPTGVIHKVGSAETTFANVEIAACVDGVDKLIRVMAYIPP